MKTRELCKRPKSKICEIPVTISRAYHRPQSIIEPLDETICDSFGKIVEDFFSPVFECGNKF